MKIIQALKTEILAQPHFELQVAVAAKRLNIPIDEAAAIAHRVNDPKSRAVGYFRYIKNSGNVRQRGSVDGRHITDTWAGNWRRTRKSEQQEDRATYSFIKRVGQWMERVP